MDSSLQRARLATEERTKVDSKNFSLEQELQDVDFMAKKLQSEKDVALQTADREIEEAKVRQVYMYYGGVPATGPSNVTSYLPGTYRTIKVRVSSPCVYIQA